MVEWVFDGHNPSRFCYSKILFKQLIEFWFFHNAKTSFVIATDTVLHFNGPGLSRPYKRKVPCWQIFHVVGTFHATTANFTQRRITTKQEKDSNKKNRNIHFKHKNSKQRHCDIAYSSKKELFHFDFHIKSRLRIKFTVFPTNNQP